jgi:antitoxin (DNA-binding transcriptional repressor) of toxin-antitoxin stability system
MKQVNINQASQTLTELVDCAIAGEEVVLVRDDRAAVRLVPLAAGGHPQFGSAKGRIKMSEDFDAPLDDFAEYTE